MQTSNDFNYLFHCIDGDLTFYIRTNSKLDICFGKHIFDNKFGVVIVPCNTSVLNNIIHMEQNNNHDDYINENTNYIDMIQTIIISKMFDFPEIYKACKMAMIKYPHEKYIYADMEQGLGIRYELMISLLEQHNFNRFDENIVLELYRMYSGNKKYLLELFGKNHIILPGYIFTDMMTNGYNIISILEITYGNHIIIDSLKNIAINN